MAELLQKVGFKYEHEPEVSHPVAGKVTGKIPAYVRGSLYRNGPGMYEFGGRSYKHLFDGMALVQCFCISEKGATYQRRYVQSDSLRRSLSANAPVTSQFGTSEIPDPCKNIFQRYLTYFTSAPISDNTQVNVFPFNAGLYTSSETQYWNRLDPVTLETKEKVDLLDVGAINLATAHPHIDTDGTLFNVCHVFGKGLPTAVLKIPPKTDTSKCVGSMPKGGPLCRLDSPWKAHVHYHHSFCMTQSYIILINQPLLWNVPRLAFRKFTGDNPCSALRWFPEGTCRFRIIDKATGNEVHPDRKFEADAFFTFHTVNAYEDNGHIVLDAVCYKDAGIIDALYLKNLTSDVIEETFKRLDKPKIRRYVIPLNVDKPQSTDPSKEDFVNLKGIRATCKKTADHTFLCSPDVISDVSVEFPQINYNVHNGRMYRYMYGVGIHDDTTGLNSLIKFDMQTGKHITWRESGCYQSEPVFIANSETNTGQEASAELEDNGILLSAVNKRLPDGGSECFLLLLDAVNMTEVARVEFPGVANFPTDFHGSFASEAWTNKAASLDAQ
ncbi:carotenoid-cleaving dioxygenase, mitochondrial-like [Mya arenaria]|uniref:carotenoid-cleaving dioxygenase, mitochondrial-like n=1 Tax=Mya arenaria TaxID=6604 RepID=UPI0022DF209A|nr:carotenoid-cleaving dioxygenase, mitochondrial-like [Mya arenaria]